MATNRAVLSFCLRDTGSVRWRSASRIRSLGTCRPISSPSLRPSYQRAPYRLYSTEQPQSKAYRYDDVKALVESPSIDRVLVDVREPAEYDEGFIPSAINIPIASQPDALFLSPQEFEDRFGFIKPPADKEVVFYCKAGVRSAAAAKLARQGGYDRVGEYPGSWLDWTKNGGQSSKG